MNKKIFIIGGSGMTYIDILALLSQFENLKLLSNIFISIGISSGCIVAFILLMKNKNKTIENCIEYLFNFFNNKSVLNFKKDLRKEFFEYVLKYFNVDKNTTFIELKEKYNKIGVFCALNTMSLENQNFNYINTPYVKLVDAFLASSSIPIIFGKYKIDNNYFYDGNIIYNYIENNINKVLDICGNMYDKKNILIIKKGNPIKEYDNCIIKPLVNFSDFYKKYTIDKCNKQLVNGYTHALKYIFFDIIE